MHNLLKPSYEGELFTINEPSIATGFMLYNLTDNVLYIPKIWNQVSINCFTRKLDISIFPFENTNDTQKLFGVIYV
jgi:hypothetical protein